MVASGPDDAPATRLAGEAMRQIEAHGPSPEPRAYEVWFTHLAGRNRPLSRALTAELTETPRLEPAAIDRLYDQYLSPNRMAAHAEKASLGVLTEIDSVMGTLDDALGSTTRYGDRLQEISKDLAPGVDLELIRNAVSRLVAATRETASANRALESRLKETRGEVQDLRQALESIRTENLTDPLTTLANRKHLDATLIQAIDHAALSGEPLALLMIDVDKFKDFNDNWGHLTGDQVLRLVAMSIKGAVRPTDTAARFGGEEFAVVLPQSSLKSGEIVAERIRQTVMGRELVKRSTGEALGRITVSIGVASFMTGDNAMMLIERADKCLLHAKRSGRNKTVCEDETVEAFSDVA
ncbi:GGDEF domain-containing protein [Alsobacter metallidurans]|uniref:diguanylate cyclase n=2 Tax=Alsobacter metallidurans TaxID=340221 RepID=A0A917MHT0_9HYPH|nr:GGDEF domain-containing protein [Alsobacter metallidurans]